MQGLTNLTKQFASVNPNIVDRDSIMDLIYLTLQKKAKPNVLLLGSSGAGKTAIVEQLAYNIANKICPDALYGFSIYKLEIGAFMAGDGYRGVLEKKVMEMIEGVLKSKTIIFADEFHTIETAGKMANGSTPGLGDTLKQYLTLPNFRMIGATTYREFGEIKDAALLRRFIKINVSEISTEALVKAIRNSFLRFIGEAQITVDPDLVMELARIAETHEHRIDFAVDMVDLVVAYARQEKMDHIDTNTAFKVIAMFEAVSLQPTVADEATVFS